MDVLKNEILVSFFKVVISDFLLLNYFIEFLVSFFVVVGNVEFLNNFV